MGEKIHPRKRNCGKEDQKGCSMSAYHARKKPSVTENDPERAVPVTTHVVESGYSPPLSTVGTLSSVLTSQLSEVRKTLKENGRLLWMRDQYNKYKEICTKNL